MYSVFGTTDTEDFKKMIKTLKDEQKIIQLEELIDNERIKRKHLEQEAKLILTQIKSIKNKNNDAYRSTSMHKYYEENQFKKKEHIRNTLRSTFYKD